MHDEIVNLVDLRLELLTVQFFCKELQSTSHVCQFALDGRLICVACGSRENCFTKFGYAGRLEFCGPVAIVFLLHCMLKPLRAIWQDSGMRCIQNVEKQSLCLWINL